MVIARLLRCRFWKSGPRRAPPSGSAAFPSSGESILMTLAPQSASWRTAVGPARTRVRSRTVKRERAWEARGADTVGNSPRNTTAECGCAAEFPIRPLMSTTLGGRPVAACAETSYFRRSEFAALDVGTAEPFGRERQRLAREPDHLVLEQIVKNFLGELRRRLADRLQVNLRLFRRLVGRIDAGEVLQLPGLGLGIEALRIALHAILDRRIDEDLDELTV